MVYPARLITPISFEGLVDGVSVGTTPQAIEVTSGVHTFKIKAPPYNVINGGYRIKNWQDQNGNVMGTDDILSLNVPSTVDPTAAVIAVYDWIPNNPWVILGIISIAIGGTSILVYLLKKKTKK